MKLKPVTHPVLGRLLPDKWGDTLMCFRQIPGFKDFGPASARENFQRLDAADRKLVDSWQTVTEALIQKCRNIEIYSSLRGLGVFEIAFSKNVDGVPSDEQVAAWQYFQSHETTICQNITNAMFRYYQVARTAQEDWFADNDCPAITTEAEVRPLVTLDGITIQNQACDGLAVLSLGWDPDWDQEHGLGMYVWKDQVIGIGVEDLIEIAEHGEYAVWNQSHMTKAEREALKRVIDEDFGERDDEDFDGEYDEEADDDE